MKDKNLTVEAELENTIQKFKDQIKFRKETQCLKSQGQN